MINDTLNDMDFKKYITYTCLLLAVIGINCNAQTSANKIPVTRSILLHQTDTLIEASILVDKQAEIELEKTRIYTWYAFDKIQTNQGAYSGQLLHGTYKVYNKHDQLIEQGQYYHGIKEGMWSAWDTKGLKTFECSYKDGLKEGEAYYFDNGKLTTKEHYKGGRLHGDVIHYLPDGKQEETKYKHGTLVKYDKEEGDKESLFIRWKNKRALNKQERIKNKEQNKLDKESERLKKKEERKLKKESQKKKEVEENRPTEDAQSDS